MFCMLKKKKYILLASKHNSKYEKQVILLMISNREKWHYLTVKKLSALLRGITSKHYGHFYCLNRFHSFATEVEFNHKYMVDWEKFNETSLPEKEDFYSHLNMEDITDADYAHAKRVRKHFEIKNLQKYHDLYIQGDTLLLADAFENLRNMCLEIYKRHPAKFLSDTELAWQAALKKTKVKLDLLTDIDMLIMVEKGVRGGICNSIDMKKLITNDKNKESSYLQYWYVNDLYGWGMLQKLLVNNFEWIKDTSQFNKDFIKNYNEESEEGYFFEIDVRYPEKLHELHNNLPFLPERMKIEKVEKLVVNLHDKTEYVMHMRNLKQALNHGLLLKKVHKVIKFNQNVWLKPYIDMNTDLRKKAKNDFENGFFKLMNNAVFGKTMENVRKHRDVKLVTTERRINYLVSEPNYHT